MIEEFLERSFTLFLLLQGRPALIDKLMQPLLVNYTHYFKLVLGPDSDFYIFIIVNIVRANGQNTSICLIGPQKVSLPAKYT